MPGIGIKIDQFRDKRDDEKGWSKSLSRNTEHGAGVAGGVELYNLTGLMNCKG